MSALPCRVWWLPLCPHTKKQETENQVFLGPQRMRTAITGPTAVLRTGGTHTQTHTHTGACRWMQRITGYREQRVPGGQAQVGVLAGRLMSFWSLSVDTPENLDSPGLRLVWVEGAAFRENPLQEHHLVLMINIGEILHPAVGGGW